MLISAEMKVYVAGLGKDITRKKLPTDEIPDYTFINNLEEEVLDLVGTERSDKAGGTTGHIGLIMIAAEFALVPSVANPPFTQLAHLGMVDYTTQQRVQPCNNTLNAGVTMNIVSMYLKWNK